MAFSHIPYNPDPIPFKERKKCKDHEKCRCVDIKHAPAGKYKTRDFRPQARIFGHGPEKKSS